MQEKLVGVFGGGFDREKIDVTLPSGRKATVLETTGKEERILSRLGTKTSDTVNEFLASVVSNLDGSKDSPKPEQFETMLSGDRTYILISSRILTHGSNITYKYNCSCGLVSEHEISLQEILDAMKPYPNGDTREFKVNIGPGEVWYDLPNGVTERKVNSLHEPDINAKLRHIHLWEVTPKGKLPVNVDDLKSKHILELKKHIKSNECTLDTVVEVSCQDCGSKSRTDIIGNKDFLFPGST